MNMHRFTLDFSNGLRLTNLPIKHTKISTKSSELQARDQPDWGLTHVFGDASVPLLVHGPEQLLKWSLLRCIRVVSLLNWTIPLPWTRQKKVCRQSRGPSPRRKRRPLPCDGIEWKSITLCLDFTLRSDNPRRKGLVATAPSTTSRPLPCPPSWTSSWSEGLVQKYVFNFKN